MTRARSLRAAFTLILCGLAAAGLGACAGPAAQPPLPDLRWPASSELRPAVGRLSGLLRLQYRTAAAYTASAPLLPGPARRVSARFLGQSLGQGSELAALIGRGAGRPPAFDLARYPLGRPRGADGLLTLLRACELATQGALLGVLPKITGAHVRRVLAAMLAADAERLAVLAELQARASPTLGVFGATTGFDAADQAVLGRLASMSLTLAPAYRRLASALPGPDPADRVLIELAGRPGGPSRLPAAVPRAQIGNPSVLSGALQQAARASGRPALLAAAETLSGIAVGGWWHAVGRLTVPGDIELAARELVLQASELAELRLLGAPTAPAQAAPDAFVVGRRWSPEGGW